MKNIWKWILGIVVILVVLAGLLGLGIVVRNNMVANMAQRQAAFSARATAIAGAQDKNVPQGTPAAPQTNPQNGPMMRGFGPTGRAYPGYGRMPMMPGRGFGFNRFNGGPGFYGARPFGLGAMILGGVARLVLFGLFVLLLVGAYLLGTRSRAPVATVVAPAPAVPLAASHACPKCGEPVLDGSKYCPSCGRKQ